MKITVWILACDDIRAGTYARAFWTEREAWECLVRLVTSDTQKKIRKVAAKFIEHEEYGDLYEYLNGVAFDVDDTYSVDSEELELPAQTATATESSKGPIQVFNSRELATVLYALRELQNEMHDTDDVLAEMKDSDHFAECKPLTEDEIGAFCERLNLAPAKPQADPLLLTAEAYRTGQIEALEAKCGCGKHLYGIHRVHWCNEAATKPEPVIIPHDPQDDEPEHEECSEDGCTERVYPEDPYFSSPCGTYCTEHMRLLARYAATSSRQQHRTKISRMGNPQAASSTYPPDPEGHNDDRAKWAQVALDAFQGETGTDDGDRLADLLGDLMHWCDRNGMGFAHELERAHRYYEEETKPEPEERGHRNNPDFCAKCGGTCRYDSDGNLKPTHGAAV